MNNNDVIPPTTAEKLATEFPKGTRHKAAMEIAVPLIGNGLPRSAVFATLRDKFPPDVSDKELDDIVRWAEQIRPEPSTTRRMFDFRNRPTLTLTKPIIVKTPIEQVEWWVSGERLDPDQIIGRSPIRIPESPSEAAQLAIGSLYHETDQLNIVCRYLLDGEKARPFGSGKVLTRDQWVGWFGANGVPRSEAGAWMRINPCAAVGTGKEGAITDDDVAAYRFVLVESDVLPLPLQLSLFAKLRLPIAAIILSGSSSAHAWVRLAAVNRKQFDEIAKRLFGALKPFGIDQANSNPSRLSRLPGAVRSIQAVNGGLQQLLWLNPHVAPITENDLSRFEESLKWPAVAEKPLLRIAQDATDRYQQLYANRGRLGVPYGVPALDKASGGIKPGQTVVLAGATGGGKTTMAIHMILCALDASYGVVLFSLEMDKEEIFDQIVSNRCKIDRNKFNNGEFNEVFDFPHLSSELPKLSSLPLFIEDNATVGVEDIRLRVCQLKADNKISLAVVDYVQFVNPGLSKDSREQQVAAISHGLRTIARETRVPIVVLSQLNDEGKLRESRVIAHNANVVITVEVSPGATGHDDDLTVAVVKGRGIPCGEYRMKFERRFCRIYEPTETSN